MLKIEKFLYSQILLRESSEGNVLSESKLNKLSSEQSSKS